MPKPPTPENTGNKQAGRFRKGKSGNPTGRPAGALNKVTRIAQSLLNGESEALVRKCIAMAQAGDGGAMKLCLERILPPLRDRPVSLALPPVASVHEVAAALALVVRAVADGSITPSEGAAIAGLLEGQRKAIETIELEKRVSELEQSVNKRGSG